MNPENEMPVPPPSPELQQEIEADKQKDIEEFMQIMGVQIQSGAEEMLKNLREASMKNPPLGNEITEDILEWEKMSEGADRDTKREEIRTKILEAING